MKFNSLLFTDTMVCTGCCATLDHIVTYLFKQVMMKGNSSSLGILVNQYSVYWVEKTGTI